MNIGIYAGSFDPITRGHVNIIDRALRFCDKVIVVIGINAAKKSLFTEDERLDFAQEAIRSVDGNVSIDTFDGLIVKYAEKNDASILIRGVRSGKDYEYEMALAQINKELSPYIETILLPTSPEHMNISSSMVKELASFQVDVKKYVFPKVSEALEEKFMREPDDIL